MLAAVIVIFMMFWTPILLFDFYVGIKKILSRPALSSYGQQTIKLWLRLVSYVNSTANVSIYYLTSE